MNNEQSIQNQGERCTQLKHTQLTQCTIHPSPYSMGLTQLIHTSIQAVYDTPLGTLNSSYGSLHELEE